MQRLLLCCLLACMLIVPSAKAQFSVGLEFSFHKFINNDTSQINSTFSYGEVVKLPAMMGGGMRFGYAFSPSSRLSASVSYTKSKAVERVYGNMLTLRNLEAELRVLHYLRGTYDGGGIYGLIGLGCGNFANKWQFVRAPLGEAQYFRDNEILLVHATVGLGLEARLGSRFILFAEGLFAANLNHYVNKTTIHELPARMFLRGNGGFRIPFGNQEPRRAGSW